MSIDEILETDEVAADAPTQLLRDARARAEMHIQVYSSAWEISPQSADLIARRRAAIVQIDQILNCRRGLDGMTPIQP